VKVFGVAGLKGVESGAETVDFLAVTSETNFMTTMDDANDFFAATFQNSTAQLALWALSHPITSARLLGFASTGSGYDLTQHTFWPIAPLSLGTAAAKLRFAPCASNTPVSNPDEDSDTYLANNLQTYIATQSACWTVSAQLYVDDDSTPIEDTTVKWSAPWVDLATLTLTAGQDVWSSPTSQKMCEEISFNPWQTHPDNAPQGDVQTLRKAVYTQEQVFRHATLQQSATDWTQATLQTYIAAAGTLSPPAPAPAPANNGNQRQDAAPTLASAQNTSAVTLFTSALVMCVALLMSL